MTPGMHHWVVRSMLQVPRSAAAWACTLVGWWRRPSWRRIRLAAVALAGSAWLLAGHAQQSGPWWLDLAELLEHEDPAREYTITGYVPVFGGAVVTGLRKVSNANVSGYESFVASITINHEVLSIRSLRAASQPQSNGSGTAISGDGSCVVGYQDAGGATPYHALRWTQAGGPIDLGTLDAPNNATRSSFAQAASGDCSIVVGVSDIAGGAIQHAFRWAQAGGMVDLGAPGGASRASRAFGVSADGSVVVGDAEFADGASFSGYRNGAYRWSGGSFQALGSLTAGYPSLAAAVSADGATIVGTASLATSPTTTGQHAFRWTQATGMVSLGTLPGVTNALAIGVSDNGRVVAGTTSTLGVALAHRGSLGFDRGNGAFRWTEATGMRDLRQLLVDAGVDMTGITLQSVTRVSPDGQWITGQATTPTTPSGEFTSYLIQYCDDAIGAACAQGGGPPPPPFSLGASTGTLSVAAGQSATSTLTITPAAGFTGAVTFACSGLPVGAACGFAPASVTPAGGAVTTTLTISTNGGPVALWLREHPATALAVFMLPLLGWRGRRSVALALASTLTAAVLVVGCGGGGGSDNGGSNPPPAAGGTPAGTSTVTVTATSGSGASAVSTTIALTLTVTR